jgi:hypothetical protein
VNKSECPFNIYTLFSIAPGDLRGVLNVVEWEIHVYVICTSQSSKTLPYIVVGFVAACSRKCEQRYPLRSLPPGNDKHVHNNMLICVWEQEIWLIDWLIGVLRRFGNISAISRRVSCSDLFWRFVFPQRPQMSLLFFENQRNGLLRAKGVVILDLLL